MFFRGVTKPESGFPKFTVFSSQVFVEIYTVVIRLDFYLPVSIGVFNFFVL